MIFRSGIEVSEIVAAQDGIAVGIVPGALLGIRQNLVGGLDLGELAGGIVDVAEVAVGMQLEGLLSVGLLDPVSDEDRSATGDSK